MFLSKGFQETEELISIARANVMAFVTAGPAALIGLILWIAGHRSFSFSLRMTDVILFVFLYLVSTVIHEFLHGAGWSIFAKEGFRSMYIGMMWEYLTPYCHCREPLRPKQYLVGVLFPFAIVGILLYIVAWIAGSGLLAAVSLFNILAAGGDTTIALMILKYMKASEDVFILDHPTDCGFVAFVKNQSKV